MQCIIYHEICSFEKPVMNSLKMNSISLQDIQIQLCWLLLSINNDQRLKKTNVTKFQMFWETYINKHLQFFPRILTKLNEEASMS